MISLRRNPAYLVALSISVLTACQESQVSDIARGEELYSICGVRPATELRGRESLKLERRRLRVCQDGILKLSSVDFSQVFGESIKKIPRVKRCSVCLLWHWLRRGICTSVAKYVASLEPRLPELTDRRRSYSWCRRLRSLCQLSRG